jgi:hypothetical protein
MGRKRRKEVNKKKREEHDTTYWANKTDKLVASLTTEERDLINFFLPIINDTIDKKTDNINLSVLSREAEQAKYKDEIWLKFAKEIGELSVRWINIVKEEINSYIMARDSPKAI